MSVTVVVGVDGSGRTHRLRGLAEAAGGVVRWAAGPVDGAGLLIVDDAHRLGAAALRELAVAARGGRPMLISRRPTIDRPELAELDEAVAARGEVEILGPLDRDGVARLVATVTGRPVSPETVARVLEASAGVPAVAAAVAVAPVGAAAPALVARLQRRFAVLDPAVVNVARVLALDLGFADDVLAAATGTGPDGPAASLRKLRDEGLLVPGDDRMIPAVAAAVLFEVSAAERRRIHDAVAGALIAAGTDPVAAAVQLRAARAATPTAAVVYRDAGERLRFADPAAAAGWFDDAADAGVDPATTAAGRAEANALLGLPVEVDPFALGLADQSARERLALVAGAVAAHQGRTSRAAGLLAEAVAPGPVLAVPGLVGIGRLDEARAAARVAAPAALHRFAEGALAAADPEAALPLLIEAAEELEQAAPAVVLPDTPHAVAAVVAVAAGDVASAEHLLGRAAATGAGGPVAGDRHRLLLAWARMRTGRYDTALHELEQPAGPQTPGRERLLRAALAAGIARRRGDIAGLREAWTGIEPLLARRTADLWLVEAVEELAVAAARLRRAARVEPVLGLLDGIVTALGRPVTWSVSLDWARLHMAIATEDVEAAAEIAERLAKQAAGAPGTAGARPLAQCAAATRWATVLAGRVEPDAVLAATEDLHAVQLPWEASRLAGQAAIRTADPTAARRLLERARELSEPDDPGPGAAGQAQSGAGGLSEREVTVARLVLAGSTHREIGAQLYIAPKTVEHHVARIRGKLGANTRAELLAILREVLAD
ncbi:LuxR C-terminal-related transcriptional regulator [Actinoplanes sp. NPDC051861]|uniref:LuxR C-terminal-related transcriptional regulator n=1 Tax=Actinoplanes sp. NPDC051861 TaxID=3155170 RepID=UPI00343B4C47